ncbi:MAG: DUF2961 domain-containing protein [bacterium]
MKKIYLFIMLFMLIGLSYAKVAKENWSPFDLTWAWNTKGHAARFSSYDTTGANNDSIWLQPGETKVLAEIKGTGIIRHIWFTSNAKDPIGRTLILRMYWDGESSPAVEVPFGDFFGVGNGVEADMNSFPITVVSKGRARNCWWQMPFAKGAKITISNEGNGQSVGLYYYIDYLALEEPLPTKERFYAQYRQAYPANMPGNYVILETQGKGHYVGTVMSFVGTKPQWWGEGDDLIEADTHTALHGTGTEDYFCYGWGMGQYATLWHGAPVCEGFANPGQRTSMYRFHILDPIPFSKKLKVSIEHGTQNDRADNISSVAFWYQEPPTAAFPLLPTVLERLLGEDRASLISQTAWGIAYSGKDTAAVDLQKLIPIAETEDQKILINGLLIYAQGINQPNDEQLTRIDSLIKKMKDCINQIPVEKQYLQPNMDLPTNDDHPIPCRAIASLKMLERARYAFARKNARYRGFMPGDEMVLESRDINGIITPAPNYVESADFTNSYAKSDDTRLIGQGARFTPGKTDSAYARFLPKFPKSGNYEVYVIFSYGANADDTNYEIKSADGTKTVQLSQRGRPNTPDRNNDRWISLGTYRFDAGEYPDKGSVTLHASSTKTVPNDTFEYRAYADAVRFVYTP